VLELLPREFQHLSPAGRLDRGTEGLLLLTNDGDAAYRLTHPKFNIDKTYFVRINGRLSADNKKRLEDGIIVKGKRTSPSKIKDIRFLQDQTELKITIHEGRKRQVRRMFAQVGHKVIYLRRISQGPLKLGTMKKGEWRPLTSHEVEQIHKL
jgi:pseudouridine synthase